MDSLNNTVNNILDNDNWSNSLLIKDEKGKLGYLKPHKQINQSSQNIAQTPILSPSVSTHQDDGFVSMDNVLGNSQDKSELVFHPQDKEELDFFAQNIPIDDSKKYSVEKIVSRIIEKQNINLDDKNKKIFTNILYNFFRNRKSAIIVRDLLKNNVLSSNKKLTPENIDTILSVIKSLKNKIDAEGGLVTNQADLQKPSSYSDKNSQPDKMSIDLAKQDISAQDEISQVFKEANISTSNKKSSSDEQDKQVKPPVKLETKEDFSIPSETKDIDLGPKKEDQKKKVANLKPFDKKIDDKSEVSLPKVSRPNDKELPKKSVSDVLSPSKSTPISTDKELPKNILTGPVQELQSFDLLGFRRLGDTAEDRTQKIFDKINLLEAESYTKKSQGIAAWRNSEVYKLYLKLGAESMVAGKEVAEYIRELQDKNEDVLSVEDFSAISDLNKKLRY